MAGGSQKVTLDNSYKEYVNVSVQTEMITCEECESPAEDIYDLVDHMHREHPLENYEFDWRCEHCEKGFHEQTRLLLHIQYEHNETNKVCKHYLEGYCFFLEMNVGIAMRKIEKLSRLNVCFVIAVLKANLR